jgi:hypothetical protein
MAVLPKESRDLLESARHIKTQIKQVKGNPQFSDAYKQQFEDRQVAYFAEAVVSVRKKVEARAALLRERAKRTYLEEESCPTKAQEMSIFRDHVAGAPGPDLIALSLSPSDLSQTKILALGAELRRRGLDVYADSLAKNHSVSAEPWTLSEDWKAAELLLEQFGGLEAAERIGRLPAMASCGADQGLLIMTEDGPIPVALLFAEPKPGGGSR